MDPYRELPGMQGRLGENSSLPGRRQGASVCVMRRVRELLAFAELGGRAQFG